MVTQSLADEVEYDRERGGAIASGLGALCDVVSCCAVEIVSLWDEDEVRTVVRQGVFVVDFCNRW
jgi:hypothetical protein